jgi:hypothetical protein
MTNNNNLHEWILKVIETCKINDHLEGVDKLIELYYEKEKNEELRDELKIAREIKYNEIHTIIR